MMCKEPDNKHK